MPPEGYANVELVVIYALVLVVTASTGRAEVVRLDVVVDVTLQSSQMEFESLKFDQLPLEGYAKGVLVVT